MYSLSIIVYLLYITITTQIIFAVETDNAHRTTSFSQTFRSTEQKIPFPSFFSQKFPPIFSFTYFAMKLLWESFPAWKDKRGRKLMLLLLSTAHTVPIPPLFLIFRLRYYFKIKALFPLVETLQECTIPLCTMCSAKLCMLLVFQLTRYNRYAAIKLWPS